MVNIAIKAMSYFRKSVISTHLKMNLYSTGFRLFREFALFSISMSVPSLSSMAALSNRQRMALESKLTASKPVPRSIHAWVVTAETAISAPLLKASFRVYTHR